MRKLLSIGLPGLAGAVGVGLLTLPGAATVSADGDVAVLKRDDQVSELVLVADDGDDDDDATGQTRTRGGESRITHDNTRSNFTKVSRDRDISRGDKTRDWTRDGGDRTRDLTQNLTNDRSRNDTRR